MGVSIIGIISPCVKTAILGFAKKCVWRDRNRRRASLLGCLGDNKMKSLSRFLRIAAGTIEKNDRWKRLKEAKARLQKQEEDLVQDISTYMSRNGTRHVPARIKNKQRILADVRNQLARVNRALKKA